MLPRRCLAALPGSPRSLLSQGPACIEYGGGGAVVSGGFASTFTRPSEAWAQAVKARAQGVIPRSSALTQRGCLPKISGTHPSSDCQPLGSSKRSFPVTAFSWPADRHGMRIALPFSEGLAIPPSGTRHGEGASIRWQRTRLCAFSEVRRKFVGRGSTGSRMAVSQSTDQSMNQQLCL